MDKINRIVDWTLSEYGFWGISLSLAALVLLAVQLYFHAGIYGIVGRKKKGDGGKDRAARNAEEGFSVVVLLGDDHWYLAHTVPKILAKE
ncbi:MAG: hypothetical protein LIO77_07695, partial [Rikenellaceae bacterium]|nr:hypothetical protein [Rikenellaceae bacterium]